MSSRVGARFRQRKLSTKHPLQIVREHDIETFAIDDDPQRHIPHVETGVEKAEETVSLNLFISYLCCEA